MIKPNKLNVNDKVAIVSLSSGLAGEKLFTHRYLLGKERLEKEFGLNVVTMPNSLKGIKFLKDHPEKRAEDLMNAFKDKNIKAIFCNIGGDDTINILPYIDFEVIKNNPKIFMGYSDTTVNHFMMYKAGLISYYGPSIMCEFAENVAMHDYTKKYIQKVLFNGEKNISITSSDYWTSEFLDFAEESNNNIQRKMIKEEHGYEIIQGNGQIIGKTLGGCIDVIPMFIGTSIWPSIDEWKDKIIFLETSEDEIEPTYLEYILRNLMAQGIISVIKGVMVGKPKNETYYEEYKEVYKRIISEEAKRPDLPIIYNVNIGHTSPMFVLPLGVLIKVDLDKKEIVILEEATL